MCDVRRKMVHFAYCFVVQSKVCCRLSLCVCQTELLTVQKKYEEAMSVIRIEAENRYKQEIESLNSRHQEEMDKMKALVSERTSELLDTQAELQKIKSLVAERENTLGSAALSLEGVREQLTACKVELRETKQQRDESLTEIEQLKAGYLIKDLSLY